MLSERELKELPELLTVIDMGRILGVEITMVYRIIHEGNFKIVRIKSKSVRILRNDLINWIKNSTKKLYAD